MKDIPGFENKYAITVDGHVWSYPKPLTGITEGKGLRNGKWLSRYLDNGYLAVRMGQKKSFFIHRLLGLTYLDIVPGKNFINHKDGNKLNNSLDNLEWVTQTENNTHAWKTGLARPALKLSNYQAQSIKKEYKNGATQQYLAKKYNVGRATIYRVLYKIGY